MDCCLESINDAECQECICHLDGTRHPNSKSKKWNGLLDTFKCFLVSADCTLNMMGDDICHKPCNVPEYNHDSGSCCLLFINSMGCNNDCICHETNSLQLGAKAISNTSITWTQSIRIFILCRILCPQRRTGKPQM